MAQRSSFRLAVTLLVALAAIAPVHPAAAMTAPGRRSRGPGFRQTGLEERGAVDWHHLPVQTLRELLDPS
jgi:hypothetical protein